jgi:hypothetical protein
VRKNFLFVGIVKVTEEKSRIRSNGADPDPYENVTDPEHRVRGYE